MQLFLHAIFNEPLPAAILHEIRAQGYDGIRIDAQDLDAAGSGRPFREGKGCARPVGAGRARCKGRRGCSDDRQRRRGDCIILLRPGGR